MLSVAALSAHSAEGVPGRIGTATIDLSSPASLMKTRALKSAIETSGGVNEAETVSLPRLTQPELADIQSNFGQLQIGFSREGDLHRLSIPEKSFGNWQYVDGGIASKILVRAAGAPAIRVGVQLDSVPDGLQIRVLDGSADAAVVPAITLGSEWIKAVHSDNSPIVWLPVNVGDSQRIEIWLPAKASTSEFRAAVVGLSQFISDPLQRVSSNSKAGSLSCNFDFACVTDQNSRRYGSAVAKLILTANGLSYNCSGALLNNRSSSRIPYFATAHHCFAPVLPTIPQIEFVWQYEAASCNSSVVSFQSFSSYGANVLMLDQATDSALLRIVGGVPSNSYFLGWNPATPSVGQAVFGFHHPQGDVKKASQGLLNSSAQSTTFAVGSALYTLPTSAVFWSLGVTETGSSGSPLLASNGQFLGSLSAGPLGGTCTTATTSFYQRFSLSYPKMRPWIDPPTRGIDIDGDGKNQIIIRSADGRLQVGRFTNNAIQFTASADPGVNFRLVGAGDFDGNGKTDLAFQNVTQGTFGDIRVWPNFASTGAIFWRQVKQVWDVQTVGDLDGDGFADLVWRYVVTDSPDTGVSYIWFTNGSSVTQVRKRGGAPLDWQLLGATDLNGDGAADMVYMSPQNQLRVLMATPNRTCANLFGGSVSVGFAPLRFADFTGGGRGDVLLRNAAGAVQLLALDANGLSLPPFAGAPDDQNASCTSSTLTVANMAIQLPSTDPTWQFYASGDLNGDGIVDIVWRQANGTLTVWLMNSNGEAPTVIQNAGIAPAGHSVFQNGGPVLASAIQAPAAPTLFSPADGAIVDSTTTFSWGAVSGAGAYSVKVTNIGTGVVTSFSLATAPTITIINIPPGTTFRWNVASCFNASADTVTNCPNVSTSRTFVGRVVAPAAPTLISPASGATVGTAIALTWNPVSGAGAYGVWITNRSTSFITKLPLQTGTSAEIINIAPGITYEWNVASCFNTSADTAANCPNVSTSRTFTGALDNRAQSARLVGGTWIFTYRIISTFFNDTFALTTVATTPDANGDYVVTGRDSFGRLIVGSYSSRFNDWSIFIRGTIVDFDTYFVFTFTGTNSVSGCHYQISPAGSSNFSPCFAMTGARSGALGASIAPEKLQQIDLRSEAQKLEEVRASTRQQSIDAGILDR